MREVSCPADVVMAFYAGLAQLGARVTQVSGRAGEDEWAEFRLRLQMDHQACCEMERRGFFHNRPENRLSVVEGGFHPELAVHAEIALEKALLPALPPPAAQTGWPAFLAGLGRKSPLRREASWRALAVWEEIGSIKVGYETVFSEPRTELDRLMRKGPVTRLTVTALIENYMPVAYDEETARFALTVETDRGSCQAAAIPGEADGVIAFKVWYPDEIAPGQRARAGERLGQINDEIGVGRFSMEEGRIAHQHEIAPPDTPAPYTWFAQALLDGAGLVRQYADVFAAFCE